MQFINDCGRFLDDGWTDRAAVLGWGPLDLFGCNREQPLTRIDRGGLLWLLTQLSQLALLCVDSGGWFVEAKKRVTSMVGDRKSSVV